MPSRESTISPPGQSSRRASVFVLSMLIVLGLVASALAPSEADGKRGRDRDGSAKSGATHERVAVGEARTQALRRGVGVEVVGGTTAPQGKFDFAAFIEVDVGGGFFVHCGGTLIDPSFVLTAAHCVEDEDENLFTPGQFTLGIGKADLKDVESENIFEVVDVDQHPAWNPNTFQNDVAVLTLAAAVPASVAEPVPFVGSGDTQFDAPGQPVAVAGWGLTSGNGEASDVLREATLAVVSDATCEGTFGDDLDGSVIICASKANRSSCQGDSGGPLMAPEVARAKNGAKADSQKQGAKAEGKKKHKKHKKHKNKKKRKKKREDNDDTLSGPFVQIGIVSFGAPSCPTGIPGGYTQLSAPVIADFVDEVVNGP